MPIVVPPATPDSTFRFRWKDSTSIIHNLSIPPSLFIAKGTTGLGVARQDVSGLKLPVTPGTYVEHISTDARKIVMPLVAHQDTMADLALTMDDVFRWFDTGDESEKRPGYLYVDRPDNTTRKILSYCNGGFEGDLNDGGPAWAKYAVELYCPDPYPTDEDDVTLIKTVAEAASFAILNTGHLLAYPVWYITGPCVNIFVQNTTTNKTIAIARTMTAGQSVTIDTRLSEDRPGFTIYDETGQSILSLVVPTSEYWPLIKGQNNIAVTFTSGTTSATTVTLTYIQRYRNLLR